MEELLDETILLDERILDELNTLDELLLGELDTGELESPQPLTTPNGEGWLAQVETEIQLLPFS